ncbi:efflux RND transporter permease subunit [Roseisolibacter agri]|uniref:Multidrug transporter n=1 Tax=Roseisolibacter agri TaxID=2014610 RepID=A0AA37V0Z7_9BACT|nr:efflux RND transporter permease subunit [Roseisolibacter agri]GLC25375.1 multidrug transporter [Roseisolibacter agri]
MNFTALFIRRPVMTTLVMLGILVFGTMAYTRLAVSDLPNVDYPTITVSASLPGASPETMAAAVATPLEKQFTTIAGVDNMVSTSSLGATSITIQFSLKRSVDAAAQDVQSAISKTMRDLPPGIVAPSLQKTNPSDEPVLYFNLRSQTLPLSTLDEYGQTVLAQRISTISGVAQVMVYGSQKYAARIQLDPRALAARGIGLDEAAQAVAQGNANVPTGVLWGPNRAYTLRADGQLQNAAQFGELVVAYRNGAPVRIRDVGRVKDDVQSNRAAAWYNGTRSITLAIQKQPGTNTVAVAQAVKALLPTLRAQLPASVEIDTFFDRSAGIEESVQDVKFTLVLTIVLVVLVIFLFLRNVSATVIPSLALPMSLVGTFAVMWLLDFSLDNLSLMALTLAVGFVVDDAIVMLENIVRHVELGKTPMQAALDGAEEIGFTIISMTVSLTAVFIPLLFMSGIVGRLFHEFAVTIGIAILMSGFVSLTLTPMLCARFLKPGGHDAQARHNAVFDAFERGYEAVLGAYTRSLAWAMKHRRTVMVGSAATLVGTAVLFQAVPKGLFPTEDTGMLRLSTETAQGTSFESMVAHQKQVAEMARNEPGVAVALSNVGTGSGNSTGLPNQGRLTMRLTPRDTRGSVQEIAKSLGEKLTHIPGITAYMQIPPAINIGARPSKAPYQFTLQGADLPALYAAAQQMESAMKGMPALTSVSTDLQVKNPQASLAIDRDRAARLGVSVEQIEQALYYAYGSRQVSTIYTPNNQYWVIMELLPEFQTDLSALDLLHVRSRSGTLVPLASVTSRSETIGPQLVNHTGQVPSVTVSFDVRPGFALGDATAQVSAAARDIPDGIVTGFSGAAQVFQDTQRGLGLLFVVAIFVIYVVLGILYESFVHPLTILSGIPFAAFGAFLALLLTGTELTVYAWVGVILLVGLVKKNAIMMIDFAQELEKREGRRAFDAIVEACQVRFRPIMMTTMAALVGTMPIALGHGAGAESRRPLGIAVVGGLAFSQLITLYVTPVVYTYLDELVARLRRGRTGSGEGAAVAPAPSTPVAPPATQPVAASVMASAPHPSR